MCERRWGAREGSVRQTHHSCGLGANWAARSLAHADTAAARLLWPLLARCERAGQRKAVLCLGHRCSPLGRCTPNAHTARAHRPQNEANYEHQRQGAGHPGAHQRAHLPQCGRCIRSLAFKCASSARTRLQQPRRGPGKRLVKCIDLVARRVHCEEAVSQAQAHAKRRRKQLHALGGRANFRHQQLFDNCFEHVRAAAADNARVAFAVVGRPHDVLSRTLSLRRLARLRYIIHGRVGAADLQQLRVLAVCVCRPASCRPALSPRTHMSRPVGLPEPADAPAWWKEPCMLGARASALKAVFVEELTAPASRHR